MSSLRILTAAKTARKNLRVQPPQLLVGGIQRVLIVPQQPQQQRDLSVGPSRPCCKSAVVVEATNMPLSHLHNLVSQHPQHPQQQHQHQDRQERIPSPLLSTTAKSTAATLKPTKRSHRNIFTNLNHTNTTSSSSSHNRQSLSMLAAAEDGRDDTPPPPKSSSLKSKSPSMASSLALPADMSNKLNMMESLMAQGADVDMVELERLARLTPTPLRLGDMYKYAASGDRSQRLRNAQFLHRELPIRLAQRAHDLLSLPHGLSSESTPIRKVALMYSHYIQQLQSLPSPTTDDEEDAFTALLHDMVLDRTSIPATIAKGLYEWLDDDDRRKEEHQFVVDLQRHQEMEDALQRFFTARVGLRFLTEHHILSSPNPQLAGLRDSQTACSLSVKEQDRGCIQHDCNPVLECQKIAHEVARQTYDCYGVCPEMEIVDRQSARAQVFTYVPHHLHYMLAELLKNSCRASVERYVAAGGDKSSTKLTPVRVVIVKGAAEVTIKVSDQGGGIPRSVMARIFRFTHSTSRQETEKDTDFGTVEAGIQHMRGFGLPLARIYARYFGGELTLKSMEGYGLDAYLYLPRLGDACENLPPRVSSSPGELVSLPSIKPKNSNNKMSATNSSTTTSSARTYSTMVPQQVRGEATVVAQQQHASSTPFVEPWVSDAEDGLDESDWEEAKMRRVLRILKMRAL